MNRLIICNTPYQVLVAVNMASTMFKEGRTDIIISDHFADGKKIAANISQKERYFKKCYYVETLDFSRMRGKYKEEYRELLYNVNIEKQTEEFVQFEVVYDELWTANYDRFSELIYNYVVRKNRHAKVFFYEDGVSSCIDDWFFHALEVKKNFKNRVKDIFFSKLKYTPNNCSGYYVFDKNQMSFKTKCPIYEIPVIQPNNNNLIGYLDEIFEYSEQIAESFKEKYIYFEEAFFSTDSSLSGDMDFIKEIADIVGKENLIIKLHPRSCNNRFEDLGYKVSKAQAIPWEVISLNIDIHNKVLISNSSTAVIMPNRLLNMQYKGIFLFELTGCIINENYRNYYLKNYDTDESLVKIPRTKQELIDCLK